MIPVTRFQIQIMGTPSPLDNSEVIFLYVTENKDITKAYYAVDIFRRFGVDYPGHALMNGAEVVFGEVYFSDRVRAEGCAAWLKEELEALGFPVDPDPIRDYLPIQIDKPLGYAVWYRRPKFRNVHPNCRDLHETHAFVKEIPAAGITNMDQIFMAMQGEVWSPNGEARELIRGLGLDHTSLSEGDVVVDPEGTFWVENGRGWARMTS